MIEDRFLRMKDVTRITTLHPCQVCRSIKDNDFPRQIKLGSTSVWSEQLVKSWMEDKKAGASHG